MKFDFKSPWVKFAGFLVVLALLFLFLKSLHLDFSGMTVEKIKTEILSFGPWGPVLYIVFFILRPLVFFPLTLFSAAAGVIWGWEGLIYLLVGANLSALIEFLLGRYFARDLVKKYIGNRFSRYDDVLEKNGFVTVLLIRLIPNIPWDIQNPALGLTKLKFKDFALGTFIGLIPGAVGLIYFGSALIDVFTNPKNLWMIVIPAGVVLGIFLILRKKKILQI